MWEKRKSCFQSTPFPSFAPLVISQDLPSHKPPIRLISQPLNSILTSLPLFISSSPAPSGWPMYVRITMLIRDEYSWSWLPWQIGSKESTCYCRRCRFDPWVGKIPWTRKWQPHSSIVAWEIPWTEESGGLQRVEHDCSDSACVFVNANLPIFPSFFIFNGNSSIWDNTVF